MGDEVAGARGFDVALGGGEGGEGEGEEGDDCGEGWLVEDHDGIVGGCEVELVIDLMFLILCWRFDI